VATVAAISRVVTRYGMGRMAIALRASISSAMRMAPSCAVNRQPAWVAKASDSAMGASSRVFTREEMIPVAGPRPSRSRKL
jgi:hypothetical protein